MPISYPPPTTNPPEYSHNGWIALGAMLMTLAGAWLATWGVAVLQSDPKDDRSFWIAPTFVALIVMGVGLAVILAVIFDWWLPGKPRRRRPPSPHRASSPPGSAENTMPTVSATVLPRDLSNEALARRAIELANVYRSCDPRNYTEPTFVNTSPLDDPKRLDVRVSINDHFDRFLKGENADATLRPYTDAEWKLLQPFLEDVARAGHSRSAGRLRHHVLSKPEQGDLESLSIDLKHLSDRLCTRRAADG